MTTETIGVLHGEPLRLVQKLRASNVEEWNESRQRVTYV